MNSSSSSDFSFLDLAENTDEVIESVNEAFIRTLVQNRVVQALVRGVGKVNDSDIDQL